MNNKTVQLIVDQLKKHNALSQYDDFCPPHYCGIPKRILNSLSTNEFAEIQKLFREIKSKGTFSGA